MAAGSSEGRADHRAPQGLVRAVGVHCSSEAGPHAADPDQHAGLTSTAGSSGMASRCRAGHSIRAAEPAV